MTEAVAPALEPRPSEYVQIWVDSLSQVLGQISGAPFQCAVLTEASPDLPPAGDDDLWVMVTSSGAVRGEMTMRLGTRTGLRLAQIFMSEPATPEAQLTADHRDAVVELLRQVSGIVSTSAKAGWGEIQLRAELAAAAPSWPPAGRLWLRGGEEGAGSIHLEFGLSASLVAELRAGKIAGAKTVPDLSPSTPPPSSESTPGTLDLLLDVQLALRVRFGTRHLLLREVLDLSPGAVVELDRKVQEPVDLLLDGRLVARGEMVVIDGSYGLRVTEVSRPEQAMGRHNG